jgi:NhaP-type Na+/H+ or K+/H+ antiporter
MQYEDDVGEKTWTWALGVILFAIVMGAVTAGLIVIWTHGEATQSISMIDAGEGR